MRPNFKGVTLLELLAVVVIIGILAGLAIPRMVNQLPHLRIKEGSRNAVSVLRVARMKAVSESIEYGVRWDEESRVFQLYLDPLGDNVTVESPTELHSSISITDSSTFQNPKVAIFTPAGGLNSSCLANGISEGKIFLSNEHGDIFEIGILASTGRIKMQKF